ncbi:hypothetical protein [Bacteroides acidifaciens]|nr:hypothetical protein [Bacteroides acidifaciens]MBF0731698.1 hypothetical protein [Bacteroides acidifaciens]MBF0836671.1 hypothetical protein [Bacteroides acidifaciens]NDO55186.1 hypothetical protein [Bacteroides acidifaciens]TFU45070.1 hypothetical protein E4T97_19950 [Bacteroides acidifaciens]
MTKKALYIFNPEHDLALASGEANYMAPASARRMASELALLPMWYAEEGSAVLAPSAYNLDYVKKIQELLGLSVDLITEPELAIEPDLDIRPWGWDVALRKRLSVLGVDEVLLPSMGQLNDLREYSHRSKAVALLPELQLNECFCGESYYLKTPEEWKRFVEGRKECLLKAPLSGSGKGLNWCKGIFTSFISGWCTRVAASQGGVIAEPIYNKVEDFAMEFYSDGAGELTFVGYSLFHTGKSGMYEGNRLLSNGAIRKQLAQYVPLEALMDLENCLKYRLSALVGTVYKGYLGVDMMICRFPENEKPVFRIHPCVEINLRMNMGVIARFLHDRYVRPGSTGRFVIDYHPSEGEALQEHERMSATYPLESREGRVYSGYLPLVPVHKRSCYRAWIWVTPDNI